MDLGLSGWGSTVLLAGAILLCRPYLEAGRLPATPALLLGAGLALWPATAAALQSDLLQTALALGAGWLALLAAEPWDLGTLRRLKAPRRLLLLGGCALGVAALALLPHMTAALHHQAGGAGRLLYLVALLACAAGALDPDAARSSLRQAARPDAAARLAPAVAGLGLGAALLGAAGAWAVQAVLDPFAPPSAGETLAARLAGAPLLGLALGAVLVAPLRAAQGRGPILALLLSAPALCWGAARWIGLPPPAVAFACGLVLANDASRRDLVFTLLREAERPFCLVLLVAAGALLPLGSSTLGALPTWMMATVLLLARPVVGRLAGPAGLTVEQFLPLSPLAIALVPSMPPSFGPGWQLLDQAVLAIALCFIGAELLWLATAGRASRGLPGAGR